MTEEQKANEQPRSHAPLSWWKRLGEKDRKLIVKLSACLLLGVLLMYLGGFNAGTRDKDADTDTAATNSISYTASTDTLERKLAAILAEVKGAGRVSVAVEYSESAAAVYAMESETAESSENGATSRQQQESVALANDAPVLIKQQTPQVQGIIVVASGAGDALVRERLYQAVKSLLGLDATQIAIVEGETETNNSQSEGSE